MDDRGLGLLRQMMSEIEGAPFPAELSPELYAIWYEHAQRSAQEALKFLGSEDKLPGSGGKVKPPRPAE